MSVRKTIPETDGVFFITITCADWLPLFKHANAYDIVYHWFDYLKNVGHFIIGYVIMPNHLHAIIVFRNTGNKINTIIANGKRFMAYSLVNRLKEIDENSMLTLLQQQRNNTEIRQGKIHKVFETSFDWKECRTERFIQQKLNYIHLNPCKSELALLPEDYIHSSAKFYVTGMQGEYPVTSYTELQDVDLTSRS